MTTTKASGKKATYIRHSQEYKREALKLAADLGIAKAAKQLKRQLAQQAEELSILKNAATYFAQQLKRGTTT